MFKSILVGMDCYTQSNYPFHDALVLAKSMGSTLKLVHVFSFDEQCELWWLSPMRDEPHDAKFLEYLLERWQAFLHQRKEMLGQCQAEAIASGVSTVLDLEPYSGRPGAVLCEAARKWPADLIAVGHQDKLPASLKRLGELRMGSVSEYVLHHAPCSVLINRRADEQAGSNMAGLRNILVTIDASDSSQAVFEAGLSLAKSLGSSLTLLHVQASFEGDRPLEMMRAFHSDAKAADVVVHTESHHVDFGETVGHNICKYAQDKGIDLIVIGRRGLSELQEMLLGSVSRYVSYHATCAVIVVHPSAQLERAMVA